MGGRRLLQVALPVPGQQRLERGAEVEPLSGAPAASGRSGRAPASLPGWPAAPRRTGRASRSPPARRGAGTRRGRGSSRSSRVQGSAARPSSRMPWQQGSRGPAAAGVGQRLVLQHQLAQPALRGAPARLPRGVPGDGFDRLDRVGEVLLDLGQGRAARPGRCGLRARRRPGRPRQGNPRPPAARSSGRTAPRPLLSRYCPSLPGAAGRCGRDRPAPAPARYPRRLRVPAAMPSWRCHCRACAATCRDRPERLVAGPQRLARGGGGRQSRCSPGWPSGCRARPAARRAGRRARRSPGPARAAPCGPGADAAERGHAARRAP